MNFCLFQTNLRFLPIHLLWLTLSACTTLEARLSLAPYTKNKQKRTTIELLAENYCEQKQKTTPQTIARQPDFIFTTDGCSRSLDDGWVACCIEHDIAYWCGGSEADRKVADQNFKRCVNQQNNVVGNLYYLGVRLGGVPWLPTPWRWGYGWEEWPRGYELLEHSPTVTRLFDELQTQQRIREQLLK